MILIRVGGYLKWLFLKLFKLKTLANRGYNWKTNSKKITKKLKMEKLTDKMFIKYVSFKCLQRDDTVTYIIGLLSTRQHSVHDWEVRRIPFGSVIYVRIFSSCQNEPELFWVMLSGSKRNINDFDCMISSEDLLSSSTCGYEVLSYM